MGGGKRGAGREMLSRAESSSLLPPTSLGFLEFLQLNRPPTPSDSAEGSELRGCRGTAHASQREIMVQVRVTGPGRRFRPPDSATEAGGAPGADDGEREQR